MATPDRHRGDHYYSRQPQSRSRPGTVELRVADQVLVLETDSGTFSPRRLDPATGFLLSQAPSPPATGNLLDLGCGYGPIALHLALTSPDAHVVAVDVNERSLDLCRRNVRAAGCTNVTVAGPDDVADGVEFQLIWSNPPIRIGKTALHDLLATWLARLAPDGNAVFVVGKHLGADSLQRWLSDQGYPTRRLGSKRGYRLLACSRAERHPPEQG